jgi:hypothetical protein
LETPQHCCKCEVAHHELDRADAAIRAAEVLVSIEPDTLAWTPEQRGTFETAVQNSIKLLARTVESSLMPRMP